MKIQRLMFKENLRAAGLVTLLGLASCAIDNDIPYPLVEGTISEIVTEGLRASEDGTVASGVDIDRSARTVTLYVNDSVDVSRLRLTRLILDPRDATIELTPHDATIRRNSLFMILPRLIASRCRPIRGSTSPRRLS